MLPLLPLLTLLSTTSTSRAATCTTPLPPPSSSIPTYTHCIPLPSLSSTLHYTHTPSNNTLSVAFTAVPPSPSGWVAWGINPTGTGMEGAQSFLAFKSSNGHITVKTFNITSYSDLREGKLSFKVYDKSGVFDSRHGSLTVFATVEVGGRKLNQVWQVGPGVDDHGFPLKHEFNARNLNSKSTLNLDGGDGGGGGEVEGSKLNGGVRKRNTHGILNAVSWGILFPLGAIIARYLRTFESADPAWFYVHATCQVSGYAIGVAGWTTGLQLGSESKGVVYSTHRYLGITLFCLATLQICALFLRPKKNHKHRFYWNVYHHGLGYAILIVGIINVFKGLQILEPEKKWTSTYVTILIVLGSISVALEAFTWIVVLKRKPRRSTKP